MNTSDGTSSQRLLSVSEALQYSPLTSSIPFNHELVPYPSTPSGTAPSFSLNTNQKRQYDEVVEQLNTQSKLATSETSARLEQALTELQRILSPEKLTQYKFTRRLSLVQGATKHPTEKSNERPRKPRSQLDFLAKLVLKRVKIPHDYDEPKSFNPPKPNGNKQLSNGAHTSSTHKAPSQPPVIVKNEQSYDANAQIVASALVKPGPTVLIPSSSTEYTQLEYGPQADARILEQEQTLRKRKREVDEEEDSNDRGAAPANFVRQERQDAAADAFHDYVNEIFIAENAFDSKYFVSQGDEHVLAGFAISRCEALIAKVQTARASRKLHIRYLVGVQRLFNVALNSACGLDIEPPDDTSDENLDNWISKLQILGNSVRASKTLTRLMLLDREEKQLYSQEIISNMLNNFRLVFEAIILPLVERRCSSGSVDAIKQHSDLKTELTTLMDQLGKLLKLLGNLVENFDVMESSSSSLEWMATQLVFAENSSSEKESLLGSQRFEVVRQYAMEVLTKIFLRNSEQRRSMLREVLSSLERLPVNRQSARHFKIIDGKPIQLASAMIMQFIQISTIRSRPKRKGPGSTEDERMGAADDDDDDESDSGAPVYRESVNGEAASKNLTNSNSTSSRRTNSPAINDLTKVAAPLYEEAQRNANEVAKHLIERALRSTKSGDAPFRNLLDIFTEDFLNVLGSSDWPAAEWLLQALLSSLISIMNDSKRPAPAKTMALDLMGSMGSGISDVQIFINRAAQNIEMSTTALGRDLRELCEDSQEGKASPRKLIATNGPYRLIAEYLQNRDLGDLQLRSARCYFLSQWARHICFIYEHNTQGLEDAELRALHSSCESASLWLRQVLLETDQQIHITEFDKTTTAEARLSYALVVLNMPFCRALPRMLNILLASLSSSHATIRSKSLRSIIQLLEKDPGLLDRGKDVMGHILKCSVDPSPLVRDSALGLVGKVLSLKPLYEEKILKPIISRCGDTTPGVRKRAMRLLKDVYTRNKSRPTRAAIAEAIIQRVTDAEDSVIELAKTIIEEIWFMPFYHLTIISEIPAQARQDLLSHISLIVATLQHGTDSLIILEKLFKESMGIKSRNIAANKSVCEILVANIFDAIIDNDESSDKPGQRQLLLTLTVFAKANPNLFNAEQMTTLRPYIENLSTSDDLLLYKSVIIIYRCVLPVLPPLQHDFLRGVQDVLFKSVQRIPKVELQEVAACMWIINSVLRNTERLANLTLSVMQGIVKAEKAPKLDYERLKRYVMLAGSFGKAFDLDSYLPAFREKLSPRKADSVPGLIVEIISPFSSPFHPESMREMALDTICRIGQSWPKVFLKVAVTTTFQTAFEEQSEKLELIILDGFREFYRLEEDRSKTGSEIPVGDGAVKGEERLVKSLVQADSDGAATSIAQRFLPQITRIALASMEEVAMIAAEVITSTNRQGLVHPKECCGALVALETSPIPMVSKIAFEEHRNLHHKHESMMEKEYLRSVEKAFIYQRDTVKDVSGVDSKQAPKLSLFFEALQGGSAGLRKKLLANMCSRVNFDATNIENLKGLDYHLQISRFLLENISLFEYGRVDEVLQVISSTEKIFTTTGNKISQQIESQLNVRVQPDAMEESQNGAPMSLEDPRISSETLHRLAIASIILSMCWETRTYLRRVWGLQSIKTGKAKPALKDFNRAPVKSTSVSAEKHLETLSKICSSLSDEGSKKKQCRAFVEQLNVDNEMKLEEEEAGTLGEDEFQRSHTPASDGRSERGSIPPSGGSKKGRIGSTNSTPSKPKKRGKPSLGTKRKSNLGLGISSDEDGEGDASEGWD